MKKSFVTLTFTLLALAASLTFSLVAKYSAGAEAAAVVAQDSGVVMPKAAIYALDTNNTLFVLKAGDTSFTQLTRIRGVNGTVIGIDFRPADRRLYAVTDADAVYTINLGNNLGAATLVSKISPGFDGGVQSLMDFNPVVNAVRLIGSNDQNYALVNSNGNLNVTAVQTAMNYPAGDVNAGRNPSIACGAYTNNVNGATVTLFYGIDFALDTFVTIPPATPGGSSATGTGALQTIGNLVTPTGDRINFSSTGDFDIISPNGNNDPTNGDDLAIGVSGQRLFVIRLNQINTNLQRGTTQNVVVNSVALSGPSGFIDTAIPTF